MPSQTESVVLVVGTAQEEDRDMNRTMPIGELSDHADRRSIGDRSLYRPTKSND
jgi:hypothetical protein